MQSVAALKKEQAQSETAWGEFVLFVSSKFLLPSADLEGAALEEVSQELLVPLYSLCLAAIEPLRKFE